MDERSYNEALDAWEAALVKDYLAQASTLVKDITLAQLVLMIKAGDDLGVVRSLRPNYGDTLETMRSAYIAGGKDEVASLSGAALKRIKAITGVKPAFDPRTEAAESFLKQVERATLSGLVERQDDAVWTMLGAGRDGGLNAKAVAETILGSVQSNGIRAGGVPGLAGTDVQAIINARKQLESGDPSLMQDYFDRVRRDKRFDKSVLKAIKAGKAPPHDVIDRAVTRYSERLLQTRAEAEASIEAMQVYNAGRGEFYRQLVAQGIDPNSITKEWRTRMDEKVRFSHRAMNGQVQYADTPFNAPGGAKMDAPGDMSKGAGVALVVRCRCRAFYTIAPATSE